MDDLTRIASHLRAEVPSLGVELATSGLVLRRASAEIRLFRGEDIGHFTPAERQRRRSEGRSYLDLDTGSLYVDGPGQLLLYLRLGNPSAPRLSPYQCALLSMLLERDGGAWLEGQVDRPQVQLIRQLRLEFGIEVSPMNMSRFLVAIRKKKVIADSDIPTFDRPAAFSLLRDDFRLSAVGRGRNYAAEPSMVESELEATLGPLFARGVAQVLLDETGAWVEPRDYLVDSSAITRVRRVLGPMVPPDYGGATVLIRAVHRVPLHMLTLGRPALQPLLALVEAMQSESPIAMQEGLAAWERRIQAWT